jgi:hypothetical protein
MLLLAGCMPQYGAYENGGYGGSSYGRSPVYGPVFGGGPAYGSILGGSRDDGRGELAERARAACIRQAGREDFQVRDVTGQGAVRGGYEVDLRLRRGDGVYDGTCRYDRSDRRADLGDVGLIREIERPREPEPRIDLRQARQACRDRAEAAGLDVRQVAGVRAAGRDGANVRLRVRQGDDRRTINCRVDGRSGSVDLG